MYPWKPTRFPAPRPPAPRARARVRESSSVSGECRCCHPVSSHVGSTCYVLRATCDVRRATCDVRRARASCPRCDPVHHVRQHRFLPGSSTWDLERMIAALDLFEFRVPERGSSSRISTRIQTRPCCPERTASARRRLADGRRDVGPGGPADAADTQQHQPAERPRSALCRHVRGDAPTHRLAPDVEGRPSTASARRQSRPPRALERRSPVRDFAPRPHISEVEGRGRQPALRESRRHPDHERTHLSGTRTVGQHQSRERLFAGVHF